MKRKRKIPNIFRFGMALAMFFTVMVRDAYGVCIPGQRYVSGGVPECIDCPAGKKN